MTPTDGDGSHGQRDARRPMPPSIQPASGPQRRSVIPQQPHPTPSRQARPAVPAPTRQPSGQSPEMPAQPPAGTPAPRRRRHRWCTFALVILGLLAAFWVIFFIWVQSNLTTVDALSGAPGTPGSTYLIVGSDSRAGWDGNDTTPGARTDTIMVLHKPDSGPTALISIPRDSYVAIPGYHKNKINAAFAFEGPKLLVETVEQLTGLTIDDYFEVGFVGVAGIVDAVGGVELCYDHDVNDKKSGMVWEAGCHVTNGDEALSFSRMRYSDPLGDIGRTQRQQQLVGAVANDVLSPATVLNPFTLVSVTGAGLDAFRVSEGTSPIDLARFALAFRSGMGGQSVTGTPPIKDMGHRVDGVGSTVLLDPDQVDAFWEKIANGEFEPGAEVGGVG